MRTKVTPESPRVVLLIAVPLISATTGGVAGMFAAWPYDAGRDVDAQSPGMMIGALAGAAVGVLWHVAMRRWTIRLKDRWGFIAELRECGIGAGTLAGVVATAILHVGLMAASGEWAFRWLLIGECFGIPAGLIVGAAAAGSWVAPLKRLERTEQT